VWVNLISNAIKYSGNRECPAIRISGHVSGGNNIYSVQDNGAGFDMKYVDRLFGVFQRLHSAQEFPGTGVGLALSQRIIKRHGGRIWAAAEVDKGATFEFALPGPGARHRSM
jgi:two-component system sensor histidine kinase/response regulator